MKKFMIMFAMLALFVCVQAQELKIGDLMPKFELKSSVYGNIRPADLKGKVVLISLFATWCGPCQKELAEVQSMLWPKYKDNDNFVMLVIGREHTDSDLQKYNERKKFTWYHVARYYYRCYCYLNCFRCRCRICSECFRNIAAA